MSVNHVQDTKPYSKRKKTKWFNEIRMVVASLDIKTAWLFIFRSYQGQMGAKVTLDQMNMYKQLLQ